ncbi:hypothetical protein [uncultured Parasutterella sp.]|uniref:hypothetical protein n=1 Tax=uncultured Parasutterella sp. TaxID=1263098 RepID=UPI00272A427A|nr:hypothetical protein [uncultured Parasutterella sp.]
MTNTEQRIDAIFKRLQTEEFEPLREFLKSQLDAEFSSLKIAVEPSDFLSDSGHDSRIGNASWQSHQEAWLEDSQGTFNHRHTESIGAIDGENDGITLFSSEAG